MEHAHQILILADDPQRRDQWARELSAQATIFTDPQVLQAAEAKLPQLIVTDQLLVATSLGMAANPVARGEIVIVGVGTANSGDIVLPADCDSAELRRTCRLSCEMASLRRQLAEERRKNAALHKMAYRDPLTGLANRRKWDQELATRMGKLKETESAAVLGIVIVDLDFFKPLNDRLGHVAGDTALQRVAYKLAANLTEQHVAARLGGDEFGILLCNILACDIPEVAELLRRSLAYLPDDVEADESALTASAGVVIVRPIDTVRPINAMVAADRALRAAKTQGRNRTVTGPLIESPSR